MSDQLAFSWRFRILAIYDVCILDGLAYLSKDQAEIGVLFELIAAER